MPEYLTMPTFKETLHYDGSDDDTTLTAILDAAEAYIGDPENGILRRPVTVTEFTERFESLSDVLLRFADGADVSAVTYLTQDNQTVPLGAIYEVIDGALSLLPGEAWPSHRSPVIVTYTAGFTTIPAPIIAAGYFYAGTLYEAQSDASKMKPEMLRQLMAGMLAGYRRPTI